MQKALTVEHPLVRGDQQQSRSPELPQKHEPPSTSLYVEAAEHADTAWKQLYPSLVSVEFERHSMGPHRTLRVLLAVVLATGVLSIGVCCAHTRVANWMMFGMAQALVPKQTKPSQDSIVGSMQAAVRFPAPNEWSPSPAEVAGITAKLPSTTFTGSARCIQALASGEVGEVLLGTTTGSMVLSISSQIIPNGRKVAVEVVHDSGRNTPMATCVSQEGQSHFEVRDNAQTFAGNLVQLENGAPPASACRYGLVPSPHMEGPVLTVECPADGQPTPGNGSLVAKAASGGSLGSLTLDEDDVEVTLMHSAMDAVVVVSLAGFFLLKR